ncbi:MAG: prephenate dehydratase domain-containing protein [Pseudomonadota bacterium]
MRIKDAASVAFLGVPGSYSYQAASTLFPKAQLLGLRGFADVVASVGDGRARVAVVPIENSTAGRVADMHGLMIRTDLQIAGEHLLPIEHCLIGAPRSEARPRDLAATDRVVSMPEALAQCRAYLDRTLPNAERVGAANTATAVKELVDQPETDALAIGSAFAAEMYGAMVLDRNIADTPHNTTRFLALTQEQNLTANDQADFTSLIFQTGHVPGALIDALSAFRECDVNMTKLETYMVSEEFQNPAFYVDAGAGLQEPRMQAALSKLKERTIYIKLLGTYRASPDRSAQIGFLPTL